ncbi:emopamil-binding family protein [Ceratobasidium sp. AG-Ba]|nr:emopamil-binding family protein [Ceratobasidium sp. AG-Ba]
MPTKHTWISAWFLITAPVIAWDAAYCFLRPRSMVGGDLHWIWSPYKLYADVDHVYGLPSFNRGDGFPNAQSFMNVLETVMNLGYVYFTHVRPSAGAPLLGFAATARPRIKSTAVAMTLSKTVLYWLQDYFCSWCATGHNASMTWLVLFAIPNG